MSRTNNKRQLLIEIAQQQFECEACCNNLIQKDISLYAKHKMNQLTETLTALDDDGWDSLINHHQYLRDQAQARLKDKIAVKALLNLRPTEGADCDSPDIYEEKTFGFKPQL